jgi:ABC-type transport system substrate-binding protein
LKFTFENPYLDGGRLFSRHAGDLIIVSKAQFDEQGLDAFDNIRTAGTGPYQLTERRLGESLSYERVPEGHWAYDVDFEEFQFVWAPESLTRMAMLLAGEVDISQIERTLQPDAEARGMRVITSTQEAVQTYIAFGGLYFENTEEWPDHYTPGLPLDNVNVRKALNKAVDREAINSEIYLGRATPNFNSRYHRNNEGWNPEWEEQWEENYGYDPDEARLLLEAEGYTQDDPLKLKAITSVIPGTPELHDVLEAAAVMWAGVGVNVEIERVDLGQLISRIRGHQMANTLSPSRNLPIRTTQEGVRGFYAKGGFWSGFSHPFVNENYDCLVRSADLDEREGCARAVGDFVYDNYSNVPMFHHHAEVTVNPEFIADYVWPGLTSAGVSHFHNIKGVRE